MDYRGFLSGHSGGPTNQTRPYVTVLALQYGMCFRNTTQTHARVIGYIAKSIDDVYPWMLDAVIHSHRFSYHCHAHDTQVFLSTTGNPSYQSPYICQQISSVSPECCCQSVCLPTSPNSPTPLLFFIHYTDSLLQLASSLRLWSQPARQ